MFFFKWPPFSRGHRRRDKVSSFFLEATPSSVKSTPSAIGRCLVAVLERPSLRGGGDPASANQRSAALRLKEQG